MVIKWEIWVLTDDGYKRIVFNNLEDAKLINNSIEVKDAWID